MAHESAPIPIQPAAANAVDCNGCPTSAGAPSCRAIVGDTCPDPLLIGRADLLRRAMDSLRGVVDGTGGGNLVERQLVKSLRIESGEVELTLTFAPLCGSARELTEGAFETLRRSLPDTDVYVRHAT
jgi:hypothetical protein